MKLICPHCTEQILSKDVNMKEDLVFCSHCNEAWSIGECRQDLQDFNRNMLHNPPKGCFVHEDFDGTQITVSQANWPALFFMLPFTCLWAGGSMWGLYVSQFTEGKFDLFRSLFGLPFFFGSIFLVCICFYMMFGKIRITLDAHALKFFNGVWFLGFKKNVDWMRVENVVMENTNTQVNNKSRRRLVLKGKFDNGKTEIKLCSTTKYENLEFIHCVLLSRKKVGGKRH